ncbi:hypothetical protein XA26_23800 [Mycolicibacterium fortuitum]|uniref:Uncharacterized protein n=1 Tax=Mycolicibacterium fortuitum TaxID=1766 RepID=A0A0N7H8H3_MYCFO|nr:hypothetical protein XA26_23800 [Mycolicibacterium fortuitum]
MGPGPQSGGIQPPSRHRTSQSPSDPTQNPRAAQSSPWPPAYPVTATKLIRAPPAVDNLGCVHRPFWRSSGLPVS